MLGEENDGVMENAVAQAGISDEQVSPEPDGGILPGGLGHGGMLAGKGRAVKGGRMICLNYELGIFVFGK